jgi:hypothetical protein
MLRWFSGRRPRSKIPLGPPLEKGEDSHLPVKNHIESAPFEEGGWGDFIYGHGFGLIEKFSDYKILGTLAHFSAL